MPVKGMNVVRSALQDTFAKIAGPMTERAITNALIIGGGYADVMTPVDLGFLVNSRFRKVEKSGEGWTGRYGYTARYAAAVHSLSAKLKGQPRAGVASFNTRAGTTAFASSTGNFWDPDAEPQWLTKGFERDGLEEIKASIKRDMEL